MSARGARICRSHLRPPPPFHSCAPGPGARSGSAPGDVRRGARALVAEREPRGRGEGARSRQGERCTRTGRGVRAREARGAGGREQPAGGAARIPPPRNLLLPGACTGRSLLPGRALRRGEGVSARGQESVHPTMAARLGGKETLPLPGDLRRAQHIVSAHEDSKPLLAPQPSGKRPVHMRIAEPVTIANSQTCNYEGSRAYPAAGCRIQ